MSRKREPGPLSAAAEKRVEEHKAKILELDADTYTVRELANCLDLDLTKGDNEVELRVAARRLVIDGRALEDRSAGAFELLPIADQPDEDPDAGEPNDAEAPADQDDEPNHFGSPTRYLRHTLTEAEREQLRTEREEEDARIEQLTADLESLKKQAKHVSNEIDILAAKGLEKSKVVRLGWRMQDVPCEERRELDGREDSPTAGQLQMVTYRLDTGEAIEWRPLTYNERQGVLFTEAPAKTPAGGEVRSNGASNGATKGDVAAVSGLLEAGL